MMSRVVIVNQVIVFSSDSFVVKGLLARLVCCVCVCVSLCSVSIFGMYTVCVLVVYVYNMSMCALVHLMLTGETNDRSVYLM